MYEDIFIEDDEGDKITREDMLDLENFINSEEEEPVYYEDETERKTFCLLGFRSDTRWKKVISVVYLLLCVGLFVWLLFAPCGDKMGIYDIFIKKLCGISACIFALSPYVFLSETKLRDKLPLFKQRNFFASFFGMAIIVLIAVVICLLVYLLHSDEYFTDMKNHSYKQTVTDEATCIKEGIKLYQCEYCGRKREEIIPKSEHTMEELSKREATYKAEGELIERCSVCHFTQTIVIEKLKDTGEITYEKIYDEFHSNEFRASELYKDKRYKVSAEIVRIEKKGYFADDGGAVVTLKKSIGETVSYFFAEFEAEDTQALIKMNVGDNLTFEGKCIDYSDWKECKVVKN